MDKNEVLKHVDHTLLLQASTWDEIRQICDDAVKYRTASVCIPPCYVKQAYDYMEGKIPVCTVIGFPNGNMTTKTKEFETKDAIENCLLTEEEKIKMCQIVTNAGADYIKTSTGFSSGGATFEDIKLFAEHVGSDVKIKAAGGISSIEDAEKFISLGADRLGTSRIVKIIKGEEAAGY